MDEQLDDRDRRIALLEERLERLEAAMSREPAGGTRSQGQPEQAAPSADPDVSAPSGGSDRWTRRGLFGRAGALAAGAVATGTAAVLADAAPAAAATGSFDTSVAGTPAVTATVIGGVTADGVRVSPGTNGTGVNVMGTSTSTKPSVRGVSAPSFFLGDVEPEASIVGLNERQAASGSAACGVVGVADDAQFGWGVAGRGNYVGVGGSGATWDFRSARSATIGFPTPTSGARHGPAGDFASNSVGDLARDQNGDLWFCTASGSAVTGVFRKVSGPGVAGSLHLLSTPKRVYDSRLGGQTPLSNSERTINVTTVGVGLPGAGSASGVPTSATAILVNLTATATVASGYLAIWRNGVAWPGHSNLNWSASGTTIANECSSAVTTGAVRVKAASQAHVILDIIGYFR